MKIPRAIPAISNDLRAHCNPAHQSINMLYTVHTCRNQGLHPLSSDSFISPNLHNCCIVHHRISKHMHFAPRTQNAVVSSANCIHQVTIRETLQAAEEA
jgi:hypothetical protein